MDNSEVIAGGQGVGRVGGGYMWDKWKWKKYNKN